MYNGEEAARANEEREKHDEYQYLDLIKTLLREGERREDRTGVGTLSAFGTMQRWSLAGDVLPLLTTKRVFLRGVIEELLWMVSGSTDARKLAERQVHIWDANGSREFLDGLGFRDRPEGDLGPVYGFQWRHAGAEYAGAAADYAGRGVDQLANVVRAVKENPWDRRIVLCAWAAADLPQMALPPCHCLAQWRVSPRSGLSCLLYQRSADVGLGVPFNIASYALLTRMIAHVAGLQAHELIHTMGDTHIYLNHTDALKIQSERIPRPFPTLKFARPIASIDDFKYDDFIVTGYNPHPKIEMEMAV